MTPVFLVMLGVLLASASLYGQGTVTLAPPNLSFEGVNGVVNAPVKPGDVVGCPLLWTCSGSPSPGATAVVPTAAQYAAFPSASYAPDGTQAALCPTLIEGSCSLSQPNLGNYVPGVTYTFSLSVGTPLTMPFDANGKADNVTKAFPVARITFYWLGNGGQVAATDIAPPQTPGQWKVVSLSFTATEAQRNQQIGILIFVDSGGNDRVVNFDAPPTTPQPPLVCPNPPAGTVDLFTLLADPSFEGGSAAPPKPGDVVGCPALWTCTPGSPTPGFTAVMPTVAQYAPAPFTNVSNRFTPDGKWAALAPTIIAGSGILSQTNLGTYAAGTKYTLNLWVGTPRTMFLNVDGTADNHTPACPVNRITFYWLGTGGAGLAGVDIIPPAPGVWKLVQLSFTPTGGQIGQKIGILAFTDSGGNACAVNLDTTCFGNTNP
jgi:hypothetical protein